eukprot:scaffold1363_cov144-Isochrysis_galbana.AAC.4
MEGGGALGCATNGGKAFPVGRGCLSPHTPHDNPTLRWAARPSARPSGLALEGCGLAVPLDARRV